MIDEHVADEKAAKKHFRVPATSLEALSAIRRCCRDMEAVFSRFHIGDAGRGVMGGCRGCRFGHLVVSWVCGALEVGGLLPELVDNEKPHKQVFTGHRKWQGSGTGLAQVLVWPVGCVVDVEGGEVSDLSPEYTRMKKSPVNTSLQCYLSSPRLHMLV